MKRVASIAVVNRRDAILFLHRSDTKSWTMPGGHINEGEEPIDGAVRELWEEAGIKADKDDLEFLGSGIVNDKYQVFSYLYKVKNASVNVENDPDGEADDYCWFDEDSDSDYASGIPTNVHVPNDCNVTLILMGRTENGGKVKITEGELKKMAVKDIPLGTETTDHEGNKVHDYSHLLPSNVNGKLKLTVRRQYGDKANGLIAELHNIKQNKVVGNVRGLFQGGGSMEPHSELDRNYHGKGFGKAMYEALYGHAYHKHDIRHIAGGNHSGDAARVHESLARKHGFNYSSQPRYSRYGLDRTNYSYHLDGLDKSEGLVNAIVGSLSNDLRHDKYNHSANPLTGHCYVASECLFHLLGGPSSGWVPHNIRHEDDSHWYLKHKETGQILDPTAGQFKTPVPYEHGRGKGFLTKQPSKRAVELISRVKAGLAKQNDPTLKKGLLGAVAGIALSQMSPKLQAGFDKVNPPAQEQFQQAVKAPKWDPTGLHSDLIPIAHLESSFGVNMNHAPNSKGDFHTAFGPVGFKPSTAHEEWLKSPKLKEKYPGLEDPKNFLDKFKNDWGLYNLLASSHFMRLKHRHGSAEKAAYAWRWGTGAASGAADDVINKDNYVMRYRDLSATTGIKKAQKPNQAKDWKFKDGVVIPHHTDRKRRNEWNKKFIGSLVEYFGFGDPSRLKPVRIPISEHISGHHVNVNGAVGPGGRNRAPGYLKMLQGGDKLPPLVVKRNGQSWHVVDGNARLHAALHHGVKELDALEMVDPVKKMAIKDIKPGKQITDPLAIQLWDVGGKPNRQTNIEGIEVYDYSHVLPRKHRNDYSLLLGKKPDGSFRARVFDKKSGLAIGGVTGGMAGRALDMSTSEIHDGHQGKGLGMAAYEALYAHAYHFRGARSVQGDGHSSLAARTHQKIAAKHGLNYPYQGKDTSGGRPYDYEFGAYDYDLK